MALKLYSVSNDIRPKQLARDIVRPPKKAGICTRSPDFLKLVARDKSNSSLIVSFPSSGWNWSVDVSSYAVVKYLTGEYNVRYENNGTLKQSEIKPYQLFVPADSRASKAELLRNILPVDRDFCFHTHGAWKESSLWGLDNAKTIMIYRDIPTSLYSAYAKRRHLYKDFDEFIKESGFLQRAEKFYSSWIEYAKHHDLHIYRYESLRSDPVKYFKRLISSIFCIDVPNDIVQEAVDYYSFEKQKQRERQFSKDEKSHFHFAGKTSYRDRISNDTYEEIVKTVPKMAA